MSEPRAALVGASRSVCPGDCFSPSPKQLRFSDLRIRNFSESDRIFSLLLPAHQLANQWKWSGQLFSVCGISVAFC